MTETVPELKDVFTVYPNRNRELRSVAKSMFEYGKTVQREPSAAHSNALDSHCLKRQRSYVEDALAKVEALRSKPTPDNPHFHPTSLPIDFSEEYITFTTDVNGNEVPINETTQLLAESWLVAAIELAKSQSAGVAGGLEEFDYERAVNNLNAISKLLDEAEARPSLDLPETTAPGSTYGKPGVKGAKP